MPTILFGSLLLAFLLFVYPFLDVKYSKLMIVKKDSASRLAYFKYVMISEWLIVLIIFAFVAISATTNLTSIGLTMSENIERFMGMIFGFLVGVGLFTFVLMKIPFYKKRQEKAVKRIDYLLPTTKQDRRWAIFVAITAGICEEVIYRGFVIHYLSSLPVDFEKIHLAIISAAIFGFAHIYQGWKGALVTGFIGFVLARIYFSTGSLLFPILLHILIDMRSFLFTKKLSDEKPTSLTV
jgi:uncharacterized protein